MNKCKDCFAYEAAKAFDVADDNCCNPYGNRLHRMNPEDNADDCPFLREALEAEEDKETTQRIREVIEREEIEVALY